MRYSAGSPYENELQHRLSLNLNRAGLDELSADFLTRDIEFWCQKNCVSLWRVQETSTTVCVWFDTDRDIVLFRISDEYERFSTLGGAYLMAQAS